MKKILALILLAVIMAGCVSGCMNPVAVSTDVTVITSSFNTTTATEITETATETEKAATTAPAKATEASENPTTTDAPETQTETAIATKAPQKVQQSTETSADKQETKPKASKAPKTTEAKPEETQAVVNTKPAETQKSTQKPAEKPAEKPQTKYKYIAFTFDDGPHYELTYKFVDKLKKYGGKATFFVVGNRMNSSGAAAVKYAYDNGMEIGVHGYTHEYYYDSCSDKRFSYELGETAKVIRKATGYNPTLMRPIGGAISNKRIKSCGYDVILWNVDTLDWKYSYRGTEADKKSNVNKIYKNIMNDTDENDIILMHEIYNNSYDAFAKALPALYKKGYRFVTVSELLGRKESSKGNLYYSAD